MLWMTSEELIALLRVWSPEEVCRYLAIEIRRLRQSGGHSQREFTQLAGIPLRTYKRFETHGNASLETFVMALQAVDRSRYFMLLFPPREPPRRTPPNP